MVTTELSARRIVRRSPTPVVATRGIAGVATCCNRMRHTGQLTPAPTARTAIAAAATTGTRQPMAGATGAAGSRAVMRSWRRAHSSSVRHARRSGGLLLTAQRPAAGAKTLPGPYALRLEQWTQLLSGGGQQLLDSLETDVHRLGNLSMGHLVVALEHECYAGARRKTIDRPPNHRRGARRLRALRRRGVAMQQRPRRPMSRRPRTSTAASWRDGGDGGGSGSAPR